MASFGARRPFHQDFCLGTVICNFLHVIYRFANAKTNFADTHKHCAMRKGKDGHFRRKRASDEYFWSSTVLSSLELNASADMIY